MAFQIKKFNSIIASMINWASGATDKITDFNVGSVVRTVLEAVAMELEELYYQLLKAVEEAIEEAIYRAFNFPRNPAERATGLVTFTRQSGSEIVIVIPPGSLVSTGDEPPVYFETQAEERLEALVGSAVEGSPLKLIASRNWYSDLGFDPTDALPTIKVKNISDEGEAILSDIATTYNPYDTLNFPALSNGASFEKNIAKVFYDDNGVVTDYTTEARYIDSVYFPVGLVEDEDYIYLGGTKPFSEFFYYLGDDTNNVVAQLVGEYWNGTEWVALPYFFDNTQGDPRNDTPFSFDGNISWSIPGDWARLIFQTYNYYWMRIRVITSLKSTANGDAMLLAGDTYKVIVLDKDIAVQAITPGVGGNVSANSITVMRSAFTNISNVTNVSAFADGREEETDLERKARFALYIQSLARATRGALEYAARTVEQIVAARAIDDVRADVLKLKYGNPPSVPHVWTDITPAMRNPGDPAVKLFEDAEGNNDALYIGARELFNYVNMHLVQLGIGGNDLAWEYCYEAPSDLNPLGLWNPLPNLVDDTNFLTQSGTVSWDVPNDWISAALPPSDAGTNYSYQRLWIRLRKTAPGVSYSTTPTGDWCSLPPGFGYVYLYCHDGSGELNDTLKTTVENAVELYRGCGICVIVTAPFKIIPTITASLLVASNYDANDIANKVRQALIDYLNAKILGEDLYIAELYQFIMDTYDKAILNTTLTSPTLDIIVPSSEVLRADPSLVTVTATTV